MKVAPSLSEAAPARPSVVSIGNFDGVHLGHRAILNTIIRHAQDTGMQSVAMTFSPHPVRFLAPHRSPRMITTLEQKVRLIQETGLDVLFIAPFDEAFSRLSPDEFIRQYLVDGLGARTVCVGSNFNFGYRQQGSVQTLRDSKQVEVIEVPPVLVRGNVASSTGIRQAIASGSVSKACRMLGRWFEIEGAIVKGEGRGKAQTVPTLNLRTDNEIIPGNGVYVTRIAIDNGGFLDSVTNVGVRPTFGESELTIETFVLHDPVPDKAQRARLQFLRRVRDEMKFESADTLRRQIILDVGRAERVFRFLNTDRHAGSPSR